MFTDSNEVQLEDGITIYTEPMGDLNYGSDGERSYVIATETNGGNNVTTTTTTTTTTASSGAWDGYFWIDGRSISGLGTEQSPLYFTKVLLGNRAYVESGTQPEDWFFGPSPSGVAINAGVNGLWFDGTTLTTRVVPYTYTDNDGNDVTVYIKRLRVVGLPYGDSSTEPRTEATPPVFVTAQEMQDAMAEVGDYFVFADTVDSSAFDGVYNGLPVGYPDFHPGWAETRGTGLQDAPLRIGLNYH